MTRAKNILNKKLQKPTRIMVSKNQKKTRIATPIALRKKQSLIQMMRSRYNLLINYYIIITHYFHIIVYAAWGLKGHLRQGGRGVSLDPSLFILVLEIIVIKKLGLVFFPVAIPIINTHTDMLLNNDKRKLSHKTKLNYLMYILGRSLESNIQKSRFRYS